MSIMRSVCIGMECVERMNGRITGQLGMRRLEQDETRYCYLRLRGIAT